MIDWQALWQKKGIVNYLLLPSSWLFSGIIRTRRFIYQKLPSKTYQSSLPIVVIGNINVGGAGKTPFVIALGKLLENNHIKYAVISKGYGGNYLDPTIITKNALASDVGDEPLLIKQACNCPVIVAKKRKQAIQIVEKQFKDVQIILSDDGLQDYKIHSNISICIINHSVKLGNQWLLPAGGLREPPNRLNTFDFVVYNGSAHEDYRYNHQVLGWYPATQQTEEKYGSNPKQPSFFKHHPFNYLAIASIAHPHLFFNTLTDYQIHFQQKAFADHHPYKQADLDADKCLLMTEKDWVKIKELSHDNAWYLKRTAKISDTLEDALLKQIHPLINQTNE